MKTKAVRLYGKNDLRLEEFELPPIREDEILAKVISDSLCMSSYKAAIQGSDHKRVPKDIDKNPVIIGHEFCGQIVEVGKKWQDKFKPGDKFTVQPALNLKDNPYAAPGYSFQYIGGDATYIIIPNEVMEQNCLLKYKGDAFFYGSLAEPMSCIIGAFHASYHTQPGKYIHRMGTLENGFMAILAGAGPMGLGAIDYAVHGPKPPKLLVVTDINQERLDRAASIYTQEDAKKYGVDLYYVNTANIDDVENYLLSFTDGRGFDDVFVFAPVRELVELADKILARDGCLNFFAGPSDPNFSALLNFYNVHYNSTHVVGTSGGNTDDMIEALDLMAKGIVNPAAMITHIGGLNCVAQTTLNLPKIPGGKKLIYTNIELDLVAIEDFKEKGKEEPLFAELAKIVERNNGLWCKEAEDFLLENAKKI
ncbi:threonine dehydrogenase-like Zn-dependent dehydrogenase [Caldicellulosiruptor bescii]|uniref:Alcohol dehydrogenase zinc-binding domain protein n=2 Tax=Caldicellulosiruptor bescii TaxID=31899 RepID=B9MQ22_CALBD|nr:zinc-binding dehydrogenase [Caldicellulosiruptor bescii]ACM59814.1 Alcohol dehydrogenase zinc-binding domain protein [Caldicellulosiruptor bescii DSM 6725]PBC87224.1 threonine dehydrogenase-like Zn-dependent dehydrogenase [Caldicellulosiruptor bescii]PBC90163.1 threonine dehydrogenase-like Zn-dependent dehydrogenase [Caldicellulosiruptor bescii]PBD04407.1 threonine dehydrogenase-like Zn-dependent dehydrogenase [Caldicellulosiruptor bescii]PBD05960.1 threonine dehydrogenase-like Zn-dependent